MIVVLEPYGGSMRQHSPQLPLVFWDDAAVTRGEGVFETLLIHEGKPGNIARHAARFQASARLLGLPEPVIENWINATHEAGRQWYREHDMDAKCVWTFSRGRASTGIPSAWLTITAIDNQVLEQRRNGVKVCTAPRGYRLDTPATLPQMGTSLEHDDAPVTPWMVLGAKTLGYAANMTALRWAKTQGFDDVIFLDGERVLEGATSTIITVRGNKIRTPLSGGDILPGTTQAAIFEYASAQGWNCKAKVMNLDYLLHKADSVWLVSSVRIATRVKRINETKLSRPDNSSQLRKLFTKALTAEKDSIVVAAEQTGD